MILKVLTYNIDGLPEKLDLNDLPWIFKPIVWIYKLVKKTTLVPINDDTNKSIKVLNIGDYLNKLNADVIGIQEDFNYHLLLMTTANNYLCGTYAGGFNLSKLFKSIKWFPYPRFKADGLNILYNGERIKVNNENCISWNDSYGYFNHANDKLTTKGFRLYSINVDNKVDIDIYILHMDADFYHPEKCPDVHKDVLARAFLLKQLVNYIEYRNLEGIHNPIIILGDTNSTIKYNWDIANIDVNLFHKINHIDGLNIQEAIPNADVDRIFYINNDKSSYKLKLSCCYYDNIERYSDHKPFVAIFKIE